MKGYALPRVFALSITGEGCQESGEIKVNNSDKCVCICTLLLIAQHSKRRASTLTPPHNNNTNKTAQSFGILISTAAGERKPEDAVQTPAIVSLKHVTAERNKPETLKAIAMNKKKED